MLKSYPVFGNTNRAAVLDNGEGCQTRFTNNKAVHMAPSYDGLYYSGRTTTLTGDGKIEVRINVEKNVLHEYTFDIDVEGWTNPYGTVTAAGQQLNVVYGADYHAGVRQLTLEIGKEYTLTVDKITNNMDDYILISDSNTLHNADTAIELFGHTLTSNSGVGIGKHIYTFIATRIDNYLWLGISKNTHTDTRIWDNVKLSEGVQAVHGSVTYWDETTKSFEQVKAP